ncbi:hypothetical protein EUTSA_v10009326mg, partial [Eutrema salsugineum]
SIPFDLSLSIFSRLPAKSIARFCCVSKQWGSMLHHPYFTELFLTKSWTRPGLLFILKGHHECSVFSSPQLQHPYGKSSLVVVSADFHVNKLITEKKGEDALVPVICNPTTRQYATLPKLETDGMSRSFLGFDPIDKQFKVLVVMASCPLYSDDHRILTLETGKMGWRKIQCPLTQTPISQGICINGVLYYLADYIALIVCFDVKSEKFKFIEAVECFYATLINYKGKLGGIRHKYNCDSNTLELRMWVLEDVEKQEWSKYIYTLQDDRFVDLRYFTVAGVTTMGEIVLSMYKSKLFYVFYFNPERSTHQSVEIQ